MFKVSVIIPAFNAASFIRKAVEAVLDQEEVAEIIIVEDCSNDNTFQVCQQIEKEFFKVRLFQHPDKKNHGCGASRNLGIIQSTSEYIAFADADNYYLPNRFKKDKEIFRNFSDTEGVYNSEGIHYYSESSRKLFIESVNMETLTFSSEIEPQDVFRVLMGVHPTVKGSIGIDGLTLKKTVFEKTGLFNTQLRLQQDVDLFLKIAVTSNLRAGEIHKPVCIRGVHDNQRSTNNDQMKVYRKLRWKSFRKWLKAQKNYTEAKSLYNECYHSFFIKNSGKFLASLYFLRFILIHPKVIKRKYAFFDLNFFEVFGRNYFTTHIISLKNKIIHS